MQFIRSIVAILALLASGKSKEAGPTPPPVRAKARVTMGDPRLFSGENVQLTCSVDDDPFSSWRYQWFLNGVPVMTAEVFDLKSVQVQQKGIYTCQGNKPLEEWPYSRTSLQSDPINLHVDGGWALLRAPTEPMILDESMTLTCRVRGNPKALTEVIFYKNGVQIKKQEDKDLVFPMVKLEQQGAYWCRATWVEKFEYHSAQSEPASVIVLDKLNIPVLEVEPEESVQKGDKVVLRCVTRINMRGKDLSIEYHFLKDGSRLRRGSSQDTYTIFEAGEEDAGLYSCKARIIPVNEERWSEQVELKVILPK